MTKRWIIVFCLAGCERADTVTPDIGPSVAASLEATHVRDRLVAHIDTQPKTAEERRLEHLLRWGAHFSLQEFSSVMFVCSVVSRIPCRPMAGGAGPDVREDPWPYIREMFTLRDREFVLPYCKAFMPVVNCTPLVIAFEGEAVEFAAHWPTATTPWLAMDRDGDGAITSRAELFGDATVLAGGHTAKNGFEALAALDDNADGVIDARDTAFTRLVLWADRDSNRTSSASELRPAHEIVIAIPLANELRPRCTKEGDCEGERGVVHWRATDGNVRTGAVIDVYLPM